VMSLYESLDTFDVLGEIVYLRDFQVDFQTL